MLDAKTVNEVRKILFQFLDPEKDKAFIFGSWAIGNARPFSDIDIGIQSNRRIPSGMLSDLEEAFEESNVPYTVEVVDFSTVSEKFKMVSLQKVIYLHS